MASFVCTLFFQDILTSCITWLTADGVNNLLFFLSPYFLPADSPGRGIHLSVQSLLHLPPRPRPRLLRPGRQAPAHFQGLPHVVPLPAHLINSTNLPVSLHFYALSTRSCISLVSWVSSSTTRSLQSLLFKASSPVCFSFSCPWVSSALTTLSTCALHRDQPSE